MECNVCQTPNVDSARFCAKCGSLLPVAGKSDEDPLIGQVIKNTFRVMRLLGEGGMGRVYEGEQQMGTTTRKVAIKTLHPHLSQDPQIVARFNRECGTVAELEHPNTIQFFDFGQTADGTLFIAMEFLEGKAVSAIIETEGPMAPVRVEKILRQVCGSLTEAHKKGIVHRDLKPENVVLTTRAGEEDFVKVLDFGIAARQESTDRKKEEKLTQQGTVLGTPPYMSPEQFTGKELDARSDIYSLGVMAYEMLTGKLPFDADTPWEWATKHLTERPYPFEVTAPRAAMIPEPMKRAIMRSLGKNRDERQPTAAAFFEELSGAAAGAPMPVAAAAATGTGTAQMAAPPPELFQQGAPVYTPQPQMAPPMVAPAQPQYPAPMAQPQTRPASGGGGKGLIIAIGALVGIGAIVGIVLIARALTKSPSDDDPTVLTGTLGSSTGITEVQPLPTGSDTAAPTTTATAEADAGAAGTATAKNTAPPATTTTTKPPESKGPQGEEACQKSANLARAQAIEAAVAMYKACQNGGKSVNVAKSAIQQNAGPAAKAARFRNDCPAAKRIAASAASIGAAGSSQQEAAQCK